MNTPAAPARLSVITVPTSSRSIVFRRGPSDLVCSILWDRKHNTVKIGQWLKGQIYPEYCDLSPDGKHMIYRAADHRFTKPIKGVWTAISQTPWLTALHLYAGLPPMIQGGVFLDKKRYWLDELDFQLTYKNAPNCKMERSMTPPYAAFPATSVISRVQYVRALRDNWNVGVQNDMVFELSKPLGCFGILVRKVSNFGRDETYSLDSETNVDLSSCDWAEVFGDRLFYAQDGCLLSRRLKRNALLEVEVLQDFNALTFEARSAPYSGIRREVRQ